MLANHRLSLGRLSASVDSGPAASGLRARSEEVMRKYTASVSRRIACESLPSKVMWSNDSGATFRTLKEATLCNKCGFKVSFEIGPVS